jgi:hypothetical protein
MPDGANAGQVPSPDLPESLATTIGHSELEPLAAELADVGIHALLSSGALKELPVIAGLNAVWKAGASIRDALLAAKLATFLFGVRNVPTAKRRAMIEKLRADAHPEKVGELLFALLDRFESTEKARLLAKAFALTVEGAISVDEFWRVAFVLENLPRRDLSTVASWRTLDPNREVDRVRRNLYVSVGLMWFVLDTSSTGFNWYDRLCTIFSDYLLPNPSRG